MTSKRFRGSWKQGPGKKKTLTLPLKLVESLEQLALANQISFNDLVGRVCHQYIESRAPK